MRTDDSPRKTIGIVGARGHTGAELIKLIARIRALELAFVSSRELAERSPGRAQVPRRPRMAESGRRTGQRVLRRLALRKSRCCRGRCESGRYRDPRTAERQGRALRKAIEAARPETLIIDISADYRFDNAWYYGLPELYRGKYRGQRRISNPGCYATAMQLAIAPVKDLLAAPPACFGVSGYSGAGTTPSDRNDPEKLRDNLMPYALVNHTHEREVTRISVCRSNSCRMWRSISAASR